MYNKFLEQFKTGFKRTIKWNKHRSVSQNIEHSVSSN